MVWGDVERPKSMELVQRGQVRGAPTLHERETSPAAQLDPGGPGRGPCQALAPSVAD